MTSAFLPTVTTSPFSKHFDLRLCGLSDTSGFYQTPGNGSSSSIPSSRRDPTVSPASAFTVASMSVACNDENFAPLSPRHRQRTTSGSCSTSSLHRVDKTIKRQAKSTPRSVISVGSRQRQGSSIDNVSKVRDKRSLRQLGTCLPISEAPGSPTDCETQIPKHSSEHKPIFKPSLNTQSYRVEHNESPELFPILQDTGQWTQQVAESIAYAAEVHALATTRHRPKDTSPYDHTNRRYRHRLSEASSVFVHTLKTASTSNGSFSIIHRSLGIGRSNDSQFTPGGHLRLSVDSERPLTTSSIDEASVLRGVKRKQILDELITTEDGYVADLKALVYLYSTLLASTTSISDSTRAAIQRNVVGLLHLHETLNARLHQVVFKAVARKWADTITPARLRLSRNTRWRSSEGRRKDRHARFSRHVRSSMDSVDMLRTQTRLGTVDPADILDVVAIFQDSLTAFFAYEEYCANHETIAHELQRQIPMLWSTYEAGMESLGRSLAAIDQKGNQQKKGLTVGDLLIKPIQRICRYPLLLDDLLRCTPVVDSPGLHGALEVVLQRLREVVLAVNMAADNHSVRVQIQRRWLIQDRLNLINPGISGDRFREFGDIHLCGALYVTYQTTSLIDGSYALCILFDNHFIIATQGLASGRFDPLCLIQLADLKLQPANDGKGIQCQSALHTWKICFVVQGHFREMLLSACSTSEEEQWLQGLQGAFRPRKQHSSASNSFPTQAYIDLKSVGVVFGPNIPLSRQSSLQRAVTVSNRAETCQVILRNTHNPQDLQEYRNALPTMINRSQSHATTNKIVVLAPKRSERSRLETALSDVWTKERLPFPGMVVSKSSQILRASAGSLARKLSLASIHTPFSRRSESLTVSSQRSYEALFDRRRAAPTFQVRKESVEDLASARGNKPKEFSELDTMDSVIGRMIAGSTPSSKRLSFSTGDKLRHKGIKHGKLRSNSINQVGPEDPASVFYEDEKMGEDVAKGIIDSGGNDKAVKVEQGLAGTKRKKRWSNPMAMFKVIRSDGLRNILHSSR